MTDCKPETASSSKLAWAEAVVLAVLLLAVFVGTTYRKNGRDQYLSDAKYERYTQRYDIWGIFHYYLGAKYFSEVGYFGLYSCALEADRSTGGYWYYFHGIAVVRDLRDYRIVPRGALAPCPRENFTTERWNEFSQDVESFAELAPPEYFARVFVDKGFNPPPSWVVAAKPFTRIPFSNHLLWTVVFNLDVIAILFGLFVILRASGGTAALLTAWLVVFYPGTFGVIGGNFLQYLWFPLLVVAIAWWASDHPVRSGIVLGAATGLQVFPIFFALPVLAQGVLALIRGEKKSAWLPHVRFASALAGTLCLSFVLGCFAGKGASGWREWQAKIDLHSQFLKGEVFDVGLANLTSAIATKNPAAQPNYVGDLPNAYSRIAWLRQNAWVYLGLFLLGIILCFRSIGNAPRDELFGYGFVFMFCAGNLSPYYYLALALLPFAFWRSPKELHRVAVFGSLALVSFQLLLFRGPAVTFEFWPQLISHGAIAFLLCALVLISGPVHEDRLAA